MMRIMVFLAWLAWLAPRIWWLHRWRQVTRGLLVVRGPVWERTLSMGWSAMHVAVLHLYLFGWLDDAQMAMPTRWRAIGVGIVIGACALNAAAHAALGPNYSPHVGVIRAGWQVRAGVYRWLRHPMYLATGLWILGVTLLAGNFVLSLTGSCLLLWLALVRIPVENWFRRKLEDSYVGRS